MSRLVYILALSGGKEIVSNRLGGYANGFAAMRHATRMLLAKLYSKSVTRE